MVCPSAGTVVPVGDTGTGDADGRGVCVGGRVAVMMINGVAVAVSGTVTSALQAVLANRTAVRIGITSRLDVVCLTNLIVPKNAVIAEWGIRLKSNEVF